MDDPAEITQAIRAGNLSSVRPDVTMHMGCCCTPREREVVDLCLCQGFKTWEAAQILGISPVRVQLRLKRFRRKMRRCSRI